MIPRAGPHASVTRAQMVEVDRVMVEELGIPLARMMELAGRHLAHLARSRFLHGSAAACQVLVAAGPGANGGGALVAAQRLHAWGARVTVGLSRGDGLRDETRRQIELLQRLGVPTRIGGPPAASPALPAGALILDGLLGYSLSGPPRGVTAEWIRWANSQAAPILALDLPSGLDPTTGEALDPTIRAAATLTLALPKAGLDAAGAADLVGELYLADIGVPSTVYRSLGLEVGPLFSASDILRLR